MTPAALLKALSVKVLVVEGSQIERKQAAQSCMETRDTLAKAIYSKMFTWLIDMLNSTIKSNEKLWGFIAVLDIYGFEKFDVNSLEQLLINYANEALQRQFNRTIFEVGPVILLQIVDPLEYSFVPCLRSNNKSTRRREWTGTTSTSRTISLVST